MIQSLFLAAGIKVIDTRSRIATNLDRTEDDPHEDADLLKEETTAVNGMQEFILKSEKLCFF